LGEHDHGVHLTERLRRRLVGATIVIAALTIVGIVVLWPSGEAPTVDTQGFEEVNATVTSVERGRCDSVEVPNADTECQLVDADVTSGSPEGDVAHLELREIDFSIPSLSVGDKVVLRYSPDAPAPFNYYFWDFQRGQPLLLLTALFVATVVVVGRGRGLRALIGLAISLIIVVWFVLPSLLRDHNAIAVALCGTVAIALVVLYLAHGFTTATTIAVLSTLASLVVICILAYAFVDFAQLTGLSDESAQTLRVTAESIDPRGILIAGTVIGALGVLDDITVTQVAVVAELHDANPSLGPVLLYRRALRVGRDHIASTVNTLVLAYVGASLPLLLFFTQSSQPLGRVATREIVAQEIVRALVGSIGLVLAVPVTTGLAAYLLHDPRRGTEPADVAAARAPTWDDFAPPDHER
jgi:uncharacterized membrane protein